ncbi:MAG: DUF6438 domain-containing protein [Saprospiraceae bacterium]
MKYTLRFLLAASFVVACIIPQENAFAQNPSSNNSTPKNTVNLIQLETGPCRGYCPMFKLTFRNDGILDYFGVRNVDKEGADRVRLSAEEFSQLLKAVNKVDLWQYPSEIPSAVADAPVHTFTVFEDGRTHVVKGRTGFPKPILELETLMLDITEAHGLVVRKGPDSKAEGALKGQVIVQFDMNTNAKEFCKQFSDLRVRPVQHLSEDNTWVIGYSPSQVIEDHFINLLRDMKGVLTVEPDRQSGQAGSRN